MRLRIISLVIGSLTLFTALSASWDWATCGSWEADAELLFSDVATDTGELIIDRRPYPNRTVVFPGLGT